MGFSILFGGFILVLMGISKYENSYVCSTAKYVEQKCSDFEEVGNIDGTGKEVENPDILYSYSTTAEEEDKEMEAISFRIEENGKPHYYRVVLEKDGIKRNVVTKNDMTKEEAFEYRLVEH